METATASTVVNASPAPELQSTPSDPAPRPNPGLLAPNRDRLAICVDGAGTAAAQMAEARRRVEEALATVVTQYPAWAQVLAGASPPVVDSGCPAMPYLLEAGVRWEDGVPITGYGPHVQQASPYLLFVFLLPPDDLARVIKGKHDVRTAAQEMLCQGHQCWEVSTGLYLTPEEATNPAVLRSLIAKGLGLEPRTNLPPNAPVPIRR